MATSDRTLGEEDLPLYFSEWLKQRRQALDLTQAELARRASCSVFALRKIEAGERRPSKQLAGLLAQAIGIPTENQPTFIKVARGEMGVEKLARLARGSSSPKSSNPVPVNLPQALTPFIGRDPELAALRQLLGDPHCSLLTIVGPGGIGKTRLAIEAARNSQDFFPDGVWFVPLAAVNSPALLVPAIAGAVNFRFQDPANPQELLLRHLSEKRALLILDNTEHLLEGVSLFAELLHACPHIKLLATSRDRLNLLSEWVVEILGLPAPPSDKAEHFEAYSSITLFLQSARRVQAGFMLREEDRRWILRICQIMEGMPLGIELSAAWVELLSCEEIAKEIERNIDFLTVSMRDLPERHRSLRATLDHSWRLLNAEEKLILSRLSVFHGSFSREAAKEICGASLAVLSSFRNKMLLYRTDQDLYSLHELIRQYAEYKLREDPSEEERVKNRHAFYYVQCLSEWEKALQSSRQLATFNEMARVIDNLSQGWQHMVTSCRPRTGSDNRFSADLLHSALFSISLFYEMRCRSLEAITLFKESIEYLKTVQAEFEGTEEGFRFYSVLGHITAYLGIHHAYIDQYEKAREYLKEAIQLLENSQSRGEKAQAQVMLASIYAVQGQIQEAVALLEQSREVFRKESVNWWYALSTIHLATNFINLGRLQESEALFQEGFQLVEPGDLRSELPLRDGFAYVLHLKGDYDKAEQLMKENLQLSYRFGNFRMTASTLFDLGRVALATQRIDLAEEYIQKSIHLLIEYGETRDLATHQLYLGKCFAARSDFQAARDQFQQVIKNGQALDRVHLVFFGLVNIARTYLMEGQTGKALEISLALRHCPTEHMKIQDECIHLLADIQAVLPEEQVEAAKQRVDGKVSLDQSGAGALAYALELVNE